MHLEVGYYRVQSPFTAFYGQDNAITISKDGLVQVLQESEPVDINNPQCIVKASYEEIEIEIPEEHFDKLQRR